MQEKMNRDSLVCLPTGQEAKASKLSGLGIK